MYPRIILRYQKQEKKIEWRSERITTHGCDSIGQFSYYVQLWVTESAHSVFLLLGLSPKDNFDEAVANMICDGVEDLRNGCVKIYYEQDETKKVNSKIFMKGQSFSVFKTCFGSMFCLLPLSVFNSTYFIRATSVTQDNTFCTKLVFLLSFCSSYLPFSGLFVTGGNEERVCWNHSSSTTAEFGSHFERS